MLFSSFSTPEAATEATSLSSNIPKAVGHKVQIQVHNFCFFSPSFGCLFITFFKKNQTYTQYCVGLWRT